MRSLLIATFLTATNAQAFELVSLRDLSVVHKTFKSGSRNPVLDNAQLKDRELGQEVSLYFNTDFVNRYIFWNNHVQSYVARWKGEHPEQFRAIGWSFNAGIRPCKWIEISYSHFSKHVLDTTYKIGDGRFPVEDSLQFQIWFYRRLD